MEQLLAQRSMQNGNIWITGETDSDDFPFVQPLFTQKLACHATGFVAKLDPCLNILVATFLGGQEVQTQAQGSVFRSTGIVIDGSGDAYVPGWAAESGFPTTGAAFGSGSLSSSPLTPAKYTFITKISANGSKLIYSRLLGGDQAACEGSECLRLTVAASLPPAIAVDANGNLTVACGANATNFPVTQQAVRLGDSGERGSVPAGLPESASDKLIPQLVALSPRTIWVELTSKCPFDCVFCSRRQERGNGRHMSFALYESLIRQLHQPELIRLNYSGESTHYPRLPEAIRLAGSTGASTELVSALATATQSTLEALVDAGLDRLSVSIHSMHPAQFRRIYRFGDIADTRERLTWLQHYKIRRGSRSPEIDFAFVAMHENLSQLLPVVEYASAMGVRQVSIHPVIRRSEMPVQFPVEVDDKGKLTAGFEARVYAEADRVAARIPGVSITIARPATVGTELHAPLFGGITTCEQNPWDTVHVLADGTVVICEVQDRRGMGNLQSQSLSQIWHGTAYQDFRREYLDNTDSACLACPWRRTVDPRSAGKVLLRGWHPSNAETVNWSESSAVLVLAPPAAASAIRVAGILPPAPEGSAQNELAIRQGMAAVRVVNKTSGPLPFQALMPIAPDGDSGLTALHFETAHRFCPVEQGRGPDLRRLGFGLADLTFTYPRGRRKSVTGILKLLEQIERINLFPQSLGWRVPKPAARSEAGISVVVPARDTPDLLAPTLRAAELAMAQVREPCELIVLVTGTETGTDSPAHRALLGEFPKLRWIFRQEALGYGEAVELGLANTTAQWVYLLNSDMALDSRALAEVLASRGSDTFAIGSRIRMADGTKTETNWTDLRYSEGDAVELLERDPREIPSPRGCLYVGGGSGLFRSALLKRFIRRTRAYAPFYWEDVEWGALAWRYGYKCIFCPSSEAIHRHRQTVTRYYAEREIARVFERNRLRFHLRNLSRLEHLESRLVTLDARSWADLFQPRALLDTLWARAIAFSAPRPEATLFDRWKISF